MANEEKKIWGIHTTDDSLFLHNDVIAIGRTLEIAASWSQIGKPIKRTI